MSAHLTVVDHPLVQHKLTLMRDVGTPTAVFRQLLREISTLLAYEVTRNLAMTTREIETPLMKMDAPVLDGRKLALVSILRAGNGLLDGMLDLIPSARVGFVGLYRDEETLKPVQYYCKLPGEISDRLVIAVDPDAGHWQQFSRSHRPDQGRGCQRYPVPMPACGTRGRCPDERGPPGCADCHGGSG